MPHTTKHRIDRWDVTFTRNVHMYCHSLELTTGQHTFRVPCEDVPSGKESMAIWLGGLEAPDELKEEMSSILLRWVDLMELRCRIYTTHDTYVSNTDSRQAEQ